MAITVSRVVPPMFQKNPEQHCSKRTHLTMTLHLTLKMTAAQVVKTSVTCNNSPSKDYPHPDDHAKQITDTPGFKPFTMRTQVGTCRGTSQCHI